MLFFECSEEAQLRKYSTHVLLDGPDLLRIAGWNDWHCYRLHSRNPETINSFFQCHCQHSSCCVHAPRRLRLSRRRLSRYDHEL